MSEFNRNKRPDYSIFNNMTTEQLADVLRADFQLPDGVDSDTDAILYIMEVIAKREKEYPTEKFTDVNAAWASFSKNYLPCANDDKSLHDFEDINEQTGIKQAIPVQPSHPLKKRRLMRTACVAAATTILLLAGTVTASALGFDLWDAVAKWTRDTFGFSNAIETPLATSEANDNSLQDTLNKYGITLFNSNLVS